MRGLKKYILMLMVFTLGASTLTSCSKAEARLNLNAESTDRPTNAKEAVLRVKGMINDIYSNNISYDYEIASYDFTDHLVNIKGDGLYKIQHVGIEGNDNYYSGTISQIFKIGSTNTNVYLTLTNEKIPSILKVVKNKWDMKALDVNFKEEKEAFIIPTSEYTGPGSDYTLPDDLKLYSDAFTGKGLPDILPSDVEIKYSTNGLIDVLSIDGKKGSSSRYILRTDYTTFLIAEHGSEPFKISLNPTNAYNDIKRRIKGMEAKNLKSYDYAFELFNKYNEIGANATKAYLEAHPELNK